MTTAHEEITVSLGERSYPIIVGYGLLDSFGAALTRVARGRRVGLVSDEVVWSYYGDRVVRSLDVVGFHVTRAIIPAGEEQKTLATASSIVDTFLDARLDRLSTVVALGGGVVGDVAGFASAILLRGVRIAHVPTTVIAQVDASIGGKTGVNHRRGKNLIGAFHQPSLVAIDVGTLATLPRGELAAGLAEVVKHAVIRDPALFEHLEGELGRYAAFEATPEAWVRLMAANCRIKAEVVRLDERETHLRAILNYGHTAGHAIEVLGDYARYRHGEATLFGMRVAGALATRRGMWSADDERRQNALIDQLLLVQPPTDFTVDAVWDAMRSDKKAREGALRFVLPTGIGNAVVAGDVSREEFATAWARAIVPATVRA